VHPGDLAGGFSDLEVAWLFHFDGGHWLSTYSYTQRIDVNTTLRTFFLLFKCVPELYPKVTPLYDSDTQPHCQCTYTYLNTFNIILHRYH